MASTMPGHARPAGRRAGLSSMQTLYVLFGVLLASALFLGAAWHDAHFALTRWHEQDKRAELQAAVDLLTENDALMARLQQPPPAAHDPAVMAAYLAIVRRDGLAKALDIKQRLDRVDENFTTASALLEAYVPHARTAGFPTAVAELRRFARAWRERWNSVMPVFMAGGYLPEAKAAYPRDLAAAVQAELVAR